MSLAHQDLLWLGLLAPVAALLAAWAWRRRLRTVAAWASRSLWPRLAMDYSRSRAALSIGGLAVALLGTALALAQPRWGTVDEHVERRGVDVVFVLDSSLSMAAQDVKPSRIAVARGLIRSLASRLPAHRVALVQAEGRGLVLAPLTLDSAVIDLLLDTVEPASLPTPGTRLATAVEESLRLFPEGSQKHRVMVLVSDGEDHGGRLDELLAELRQSGVVVHALGVGSLEGTPIPLPGDDEYKKDDNGRVVVTRLNENLLEQLSRETGGLYIRASSLGTDLTPVLERIDSMERRSVEDQMRSALAERFQWPLLPAVAGLLLHLASSPYRRFFREVAR